MFLLFFSMFFASGSLQCFVRSSLVLLCFFVLVPFSFLFFFFIYFLFFISSSLSCVLNSKVTSYYKNIHHIRKTCLTLHYEKFTMHHENVHRVLQKCSSYIKQNVHHILIKCSLYLKNVHCFLKKINSVSFRNFSLCIFIEY